MPNAFDAKYHNADKQFVSPLIKIKSPPRIYGIDLLRGICIILMILDHSSFDFSWLPLWNYEFYYKAPDWLFGLSNWCYEWWYSTARMVIRLTVVCVFFVLSGISSVFSRNNFMRGIKLAAASFALSMFTVSADNLFDMGISIIFGVLHCFTVAILLYAVLDLLLKDKAKYACLGLGIVLFLWGLSFDFFQQSPLNNLTGRDIGFIEYFQIVTGSRYYGADCFGIMPWAGIFLIGVYGGTQLYRRKIPYLPILGHKVFYPVRFVGRNAIWFYLLHQPIVFGIIAMICRFYVFSII